MLEEFSEVFYCVNYEILLAKLHFNGIQGTCANWFRSYLHTENKKLKQSSNVSQNCFETRE